MKHIKKSFFLLAPVLLASVALAQTRDAQVANSASEENSIAAARSQYTQTSDIPPDPSNTTLAQLHRGGPGRPFPPQRGYPRGAYQTPWMDHGNAGHIFIGAAIGFGVGAALGATGSARNGTPVSGGIVIGGGLFALLGGCVGKAVGDLQGLHFASAHHRGIHRPSSPEDDELGEVRRQSKGKEGQPEGSASPDSHGQRAGVEAMAQASPMPAVP